MHTNIFSELSIIIAIGASVALVMRLLRQPLIIGHIVTGILVGPAVFHVVNSQETIEVFAKIGIALLLFIIGLGLNPKVVKEVGKAAGLVGSLQILVTGGISYVVAFAFGRSRMESLFIAVALAFSSTIIILKLLSDKKEHTRLYGKISIGILLIQDIVATLALIMTTGSHDTASKHGILILLLKGIMLTVPLFVIAAKVLPHLRQLLAGSQEFLFLFAIGWGFGAAALFEHFGFSVEIGALFAGVSLAGLPYAQEISARLRPLRDFFVIVFFISLGTRLSLGSIGKSLPIIIAFSIITVIVKPLIVMVLLGLFRYTKRTSFKAGTSLAQVSEFSLVFIILGASQGIIGNDLVSVMTIVALISITASTYLIVFSDQIYDLFEKHLSLFERRVTHAEHEHRTHYDLILFGYKKGGAEFIKVFESLKKRFVVIDYDPDVIEIMEHRQLPYLYGDATDIEMLEEANLDHAKLVVSTVTDFTTNKFLADWLNHNNSSSVFICAADNAHQAADLYELGTSYVMLPHYIGSEKISAFIKKSGLKKSEFKKYREKHLQYIESYTLAHDNDEHHNIGRVILEKLESTVPLPNPLSKTKR